MSEPLRLTYPVDGSNFAVAGDASMKLKKELQSLGFDPKTIRRTSICMYEGEINMVIHAGGGEVEVLVSPEQIEIFLRDEGPGIPDIPLAMKAGYSTAPEDVRNSGFGAGMGLPNMKKNADFMEIESTVGVGTTVHMQVLVS